MTYLAGCHPLPFTAQNAANLPEGLSACRNLLLMSKMPLLCCMVLELSGVDILPADADACVLAA
jgi:hypothetical protein